MVIVNTVVYVRDYLGGTESDTAIAFAATGSGSMVVALLLPRFLKRHPDRPFMLAGGVFLGLGLLFGVTMPSLFGLLPIWFVLGAGSSLIQTPAGRLLKKSSNEGDRPTIFAAQFALSHACWLLAHPLAGWMGATFSRATVFTVLALITLITTVVAAVLWPTHDLSEVEHMHQPIEHEHFHTHDEHHQHSHEGWEGLEPHRHPHTHAPLKHKHTYVIDLHHPEWPSH
ncbi:MAG: MFS family permease [Parasphingorhabdus sp.]|jgi:MFS family permease